MNRQSPAQNGHSVIPEKVPHVPSAQLPEDKEFWDGNVLGWPSEAEKPVTPLSSPPLAANPLMDKKPFIDPVANTPALSDIPDFSEFETPVNMSSEPEPKSTFDLSDVPPGIREIIELSPPPPPSVDSLVELNTPPAPIVKENGNGSATFIAASDPDMPDFPMSPISDETHDVAPLKNYPPVDALNVEVAAMPALESNSEFPIPGTLFEKPKKEESFFEDEPEYSAQSLKPENLIQVACVYPEGQEKNGQSFISRLREAAEKLSKEVQPVFIEPWSAGSLDPMVWAKSAEVSGADFMFVLCSKSEQETMKSLMRKIPANGIGSRLVLIEQIPLKTLYADILIKLNRGQVL